MNPITNISLKYLYTLRKNKSTINYMMNDHKEIMSCLKFIGKIKKGEKINVKNMYVQSDSLITRLSRTFYNQDNRQNSLNFVTTTMNRGFELIYTYMNSKRECEKQHCKFIIKDIRASLAGISNLKHTYNEDMMFCCNIDTILQDITARLIELAKKYPSIHEIEHDKKEPIVNSA